VKKKSLATPQDKKDWTAYTRNPGEIHDKEESNKVNKVNRIRKLDLHGATIDEANELVKKFIIDSHERGYKKIIIITGKGLRSKIYDDPYISRKAGVLRNSVPDYISSDVDLSKIIKSSTKADKIDGGDGAIYVFLKNKLG